MFLFLYLCCCRKVKDAWESKRDVLIQSGAFAIEQLSEAMSVKAESYKLSEGITQSALHKCAKQVSILPAYSY